MQKQNTLHVFSNSDKKWHEKWSKRRNLCNIPHPFRALIIGVPNCGKTSTAKNLVVFQDPPFEEIIIVHVDHSENGSNEWADCDPTEILDDIPGFDLYDKDTKRLLIFEDVWITKLNIERQKLIDRWWGYGSTHKNTSIILCQQNPGSIPTTIRQMANLYILWKRPDMRSLNDYASRMGLENGEIKKLMDKHCKEVHDSIWLDRTDKTPAPLRLNCFEKIQRECLS